MDIKLLGNIALHDLDLKRLFKFELVALEHCLL